MKKAVLLHPQNKGSLKQIASLAQLVRASDC